MGHYKKTRFGQSYMIVDAFIVLIVKGPSIANGDGKALQKLADKCQSVLKIHLRKVVARLPFYNQSRWSDRASDLLRGRGIPPNFRDLQNSFKGERNQRITRSLEDPDKEISNRSKREKKYLQN